MKQRVILILVFALLCVANTNNFYSYSNPQSPQSFLLSSISNYWIKQYKKEINLFKNIIIIGGNGCDLLAANNISQEFFAPIIYNDKNFISPHNIHTIKTSKVTNAILIGDFQLLSKQLEQYLQNIGVQTTRIPGNTCEERQENAFTQFSLAPIKTVSILALPHLKQATIVSPVFHTATTATRMQQPIIVKDLSTPAKIRKVAHALKAKNITVDKIYNVTDKTLKNYFTKNLAFTEAYLPGNTSASQKSPNFNTRFSCFNNNKAISILRDLSKNENLVSGARRMRSYLDLGFAKPLLTRTKHTYVLPGELTQNVLTNSSSNQDNNECATPPGRSQLVIDPKIFINKQLRSQDLPGQPAAPPKLGQFLSNQYPYALKADLPNRISS